MSSQDGGRAPLKVITREELRARREKELKRRKKMRVVFVVVCALILALIVFLFVLAVKGIKKLVSGSGARSHSCAAWQLEYGGDGKIAYTGGRIYILGEDNIMCAAESGEMLWSLDSGYKDGVILPLSDGVIVYGKGDKTIARYGDSGTVWQKTVDSPISSISLCEKAGEAVVRLASESGGNTLSVLKIKDEKTIDEAVLEKKYTSNYVMGAVVSPGGKSLAVSEFTEVDGKAATKITVADISTGRSYFSKIIENETVPYLSFVSENVLTAAGGKNVYVIENLNKNTAQAVRFRELISVGDTGEKVLTALAAGGRVVAAVGNGEGKTTVSIYDAAAGKTDSFVVSEAVKGLAPCGEDFFAVYTRDSFGVYDFSGTLAASCEEKINVENVAAGADGSFVISGSTGITIINFK
ncbi:MAG: hypothetical protein IKX06_03895 [Clostridia bacterium]|nr:hypothetical protein [Clostridia bacterium]